jgi:hypothetical protein
MSNSDSLKLGPIDQIGLSCTDLDALKSDVPVGKAR